MLRKMRFEGPPSRFDELVDAARGTGLELDDYAIDTTGAYGWPMCGNGLAVVIVVVDDDEWAPKEIASALRAAHERMTGASGDWIASAGSCPRCTPRSTRMSPRKPPGPSAMMTP